MSCRFPGGFATFAQTGGTTTGGGGGGVSLYQLPWTTVDLTDGTWTLYDPDSKLDTSFGTNGVFHNLGYNRVQWGASATGSDYNWSAGPDHRSPRWYKDLTIDGNAIKTGDFLTLAIRSQLDNAVDDFDQQVVFGTSVWPDLVTDTAVGGVGAIITKLQGGNNAFGAWTVQSSSTHTNRTYMVSTVTRGGGGVGASAYQVYDATNTATGAGSRATTLVGSLTLNVRLIVGIGIRQNTETVVSGNNQRFAFQYAAITNPI